MGMHVKLIGGKGEKRALQRVGCCACGVQSHHTHDDDDDDDDDEHWLCGENVKG